jgi:hypothetical protein
LPADAAIIDFRHECIIWAHTATTLTSQNEHQPMAMTAFGPYQEVSGDNRHHRAVTHPRGGRTDVPGRPGNGDQMGGVRPHQVDPHPWGTPQVPRVRSQRSPGRSFRRRVPVDRLRKGSNFRFGQVRRSHCICLRRAWPSGAGALGGLVAAPIRMAANRESQPVSTGLGAPYRVHEHLTVPRALNRRLCLTVTPIVAVPQAEPQQDVQSSISGPAPP